MEYKKKSGMGEEMIDNDTGSTRRKEQRWSFGIDRVVNLTSQKQN